MTDQAEGKDDNLSLRVVIAEDEAIIRMDLRETLEEEGYVVVGETGRGDKAVELVRDLQPDLVILDVKMPGILTSRIARSGCSARTSSTAWSPRPVSPTTM